MPKSRRSIIVGIFAFIISGYTYEVIFEQGRIIGLLLAITFYLIVTDIINSKTTGELKHEK